MQEPSSVDDIDEALARSVVLLQSARERRLRADRRIQESGALLRRVDARGRA